VPNTLQFPDRLRLIDERSAAFRAAIAAAPSLDVQVPTCPDWTLLDLVQHIGNRRRSWAATIAAGPDAPGRVEVEAEAPEREAQTAWLAEGTRQMLDALREAGPDRGCWVWWGDSQSPQTCGAVARHQLQEISVHTYDAQITLGSPQPVPEEIALDGVDDFLSTVCSTSVAWPYQSEILDYHADEGRSWRVSLAGDGVRVAEMSEAVPADASVTGSASDLVLFFYDRLSTDSVKVEGDRTLLTRIIEWDPGA
jgi:uncharacterized protein (TIGR03083 family)